MLPGETIRSGADPTCDECGVTVKLQVCQSAAGYYIGTMCDCGPYSRESDYYSTHEAAQLALDTDIVDWR
jgi:hypothetical protein